MSEVQSCVCGPEAPKPVVGKKVNKTNNGGKKLLSWSVGGGLLCILACAAGPLLLGLGITLTAGAIATGLGILAVAGLGVFAFAAIKTAVKRRRNKVLKPVFIPAPLDSAIQDIACNPSAIDPSQRNRHEVLFETLLSKAKDIANTGEYIVFHYPAGQENFTNIMNWVRDEQKCCPFLTFKIEVLPKKEDIVLSLGEGKEITDYMMSLIRGKTDR